MVFATSAMPCWGKKSKKNMPRFMQKHPSNRHPNLHRFGNQLASILGGFGEPSWDQIGTNRSPNRSKNYSKKISQIIIPTWIDLGTNLAPFWEGLGSQVGAKLAPNRFKSRSKKRYKKWSPFGSPQDRFLVDLGCNLPPKRRVEMFGFFVHFRSWGLLGPSGAQDPPKSSPRGLLGPIQEDFDPHFGGFWEDLGAHLGGF